MDELSDMRRGEPPAAPTPLLPAVSLGAVPPVIERRQVRIEWPEVAGAAGYAVKLVSTGTVPVLLVDLPVAAAGGACPPRGCARTRC